MKKLGEVLQSSIGYLKERKITRARRTVEELLSHVLGFNRLDLYLKFDFLIEESELVLCRQFLRRAAQGEPLEYILGEKNFYHCQLWINSNVLIPRQETEILLDIICSNIKEEKGIAWDLCCGSGCLGIGLKKAIPALAVTLSDLSLSALELAKKNAERNSVDVGCLHGDLLAPFEGKKADFVLCNPPYISEDEYAHLDPSVRGFEPKEALLGGLTGLEFYCRLAEELPYYLNPGAKVFFEIGANQGEGVLSLFSASCWKAKRVQRDWSNLERFFFLEFE